jgi:hypothetical protein
MIDALSIVVGRISFFGVPPPLGTSHKVPSFSTSV